MTRVLGRHCRCCCVRWRMRCYDTESWRGGQLACLLRCLCRLLLLSVFKPALRRRWLSRRASSALPGLPSCRRGRDLLPPVAPTERLQPRHRRALCDRILTRYCRIVCVFVSLLAMKNEPCSPPDERLDRCVPNNMLAAAQLSAASNACALRLETSIYRFLNRSCGLLRSAV